MIKFRPNPTGNEITPMQFSIKLSARNKFKPPVLYCSISILSYNFFIWICRSIIFFFLKPLQIKLSLLLLLILLFIFVLLFFSSILLFDLYGFCE